jgi:hypothetical protein
MAQEIDINLNVNTEEANKSLGSLKTQLRQAQAEVGALADKFGATSKEAVEAAKKAAELKDRIGDAKTLTDAFNPDAKFKSLTGALTGVAGGFSVVTGAMGAFGGQSKAVEESLLKVQSAMAMASGLQAVGESVDQFKQLGAVVKSFTIVQRLSTVAQGIYNAVMAANPIGAIVLVVTALIGAGYALIKMFQASNDAVENAEKANKALNKELETQVKNQKLATQESDLSRDAQLKMAKASGQSAEEIRKLSVELANQEVTQKMANAQTLRAIAIEAIRVAGLEDATDSEKESAKNALKAFNEANDALKTSVLNRRKLLIDNKAEETQEQTDATKEANEKANAKRDEAHKNELDAIKKANADKLAEQKKLEQDKRNLFEKSIQEALDLAKSLNESIETPAQKENREYLEKKAILENNYLSTEILDKQHKDNLAQIDLDYYTAEADKAIERTAKQSQIDAKAIADEQTVADAKLAIQNAQLDNVSKGISLLQGLGIKNKAIQKGLVIAENAAGIAKIIINTMAANAKALQLGPALAPPTIVANNISAVIGVAGSIAATVKALSALGGGSAGGSSSMPSAGGGGVQSAPQFNVVGQSGANQVAQSIGGQMQQPIKAFVVGQDVTTQQGLNSSIVQNATLG